MTTYYSNSLKGSGNELAKVGAGYPSNAVILYGEVTGSAAFTTADTLNFFKPPKGFRAVYWVLDATDQDSSTGITINIGDSGSATRVFSASSVAQAATTAPATLTGGIGYKYDGDTMVTGVLQANASGTAAAGTFYLTAIGVIEGAAS